MMLYDLDLSLKQKRKDGIFVSNKFSFLGAQVAILYKDELKRVTEGKGLTLLSNKDIIIQKSIIMLAKWQSLPYQ
jgi:hypothetical protein